MPPTPAEVTTYLLREGPPKPELRFRDLPEKDRVGLKFGGYEDVVCSEKSFFEGHPFWRCYYTVTAITSSGRRLADKGWVILGRSESNNLQPIPLATVGTNAPETGANSASPEKQNSPRDPIADMIIRNGEGTTEIERDVNRDGKVIRCEVTHSSGAQELDDAACRVFTEKARFVRWKGAKGTEFHRYGMKQRIVWRITE